MSQKDLLFRGYTNFQAFYFDLMVKSRSGPFSTQDMYQELEKAQQRECLLYLLEEAKGHDKDAFNALEAIAVIV